MKVDLYPVTDAELCLIYRRRARRTQTEVGEAIGSHRWAVRRMERGHAPCGELLKYWEEDETNAWLY